MNIIKSFLLVRCFILTLVLGFPLQISTPPQITTKYYKQDNTRECKYVEEVGFIIEPDFAGRDSVQVVQELDILATFEDPYSSSPTSWCDYSTLLYWLCSGGKDAITNSFPDIHLPIRYILICFRMLSTCCVMMSLWLRYLLNKYQITWPTWR